MKSGKLPELGVIGWPLQKTFSPIIQNSALRAKKLEWRYEAIPVSPEELEYFFKTAAQHMIGFNVTIPHKRRVYELCDEKSPFARLCESVNTVVFEKGSDGARILGYNTDGPALIKALRIRGVKTIGSVLCLGAGGAASSAIAAVLCYGAKYVAIANRTLEKAKAMTDHFAKIFPVTRFEVLELRNEQVTWVAREVELVVNCLPEEVAARIENCFTNSISNKLFCDYSYGEEPTRLYSKAKKLGYLTISGLEILVWQGAYAFEIFTKIRCPVESMIHSLKEKIGSWWLEC